MPYLKGADTVSLQPVVALWECGSGVTRYADYPNEPEI